MHLVGMPTALDTHPNTKPSASPYTQCLRCLVEKAPGLAQILRAWLVLPRCSLHRASGAVALLLGVALAPSLACAPVSYSPPPSRPADAPVSTADGRIIGVERGSPSDPAAYVHLIVQPGSDAPIRVELGPGWYLDEQGLRFSKDEIVSVQGRSEVRANSSVFVARSIRKGEETIELRDEHGQPKWRD